MYSSSQSDDESECLSRLLFYYEEGTHTVRHKKETRYHLESRLIIAEEKADSCRNPLLLGVGLAHQDRGGPDSVRVASAAC